jgi:hypothetical protein
VQPSLHRAHFGTQQHGHLPLGQAREVEQHDGVSLAGGQLFYGTTDLRVNSRSAAISPGLSRGSTSRSARTPGMTHRHRLNRGGNRRLNWALHYMALY